MNGQHASAHHPRRAPLPLTPDEARKVTFQQSPLAWRGYSEQEVDEFVARTVQALETAQRETVALHTEVNRLRNFYRQHGTEIDRLADRHAGWSDPRASRPLIAEAKSYTDTQVVHADSYADLVATDAHHHADEALAHAQVRSRILAEELVRTFVSRTPDPRRAQLELDQVALWLRALGEALWSQTDAMTQVIDAQLGRPMF